MDIRHSQFCVITFAVNIPYTYDYAKQFIQNVINVKDKCSHYYKDFGIMLVATKCDVIYDEMKNSNDNLVDLHLVIKQSKNGVFHLLNVVH